jgi:hypothetical protein
MSPKQTVDQIHIWRKGMHGRGLGESAADVAIIEFERVDSVKMDDGMVLPIGSDVYRAAWTGGGGGVLHAKMCDRLQSPYRDWRLISVRR